MLRREGIANLLQAAIFVGGALYLGDRWGTFYALIGAAAAAQAALGVGLLSGRAGRRAAAAVNLLTLAVTALILGLYLQVCLHIGRTFSPEAVKTAERVMGGALLAIPYGVVIPLWQLLRYPPTGAGGAAGAAATLAALVLPPLSALPHPMILYPEIDGVAASTWLRSGGESGDPPSGPGPVMLAVAVPSDTGMKQIAEVESDDLATALRELRDAPGVAGAEALILEAAVRETPLPSSAPDGYAMLRPGAEGLRARKGLVAAGPLWRRGPRSPEILPGVRVPMVPLKGFNDVTARVHTRAWMATADGVTPMRGSWSEPAELSAEALAAAALEGGRHIVRNQRPDGRFTYVVAGPTGDRKGGYNYPRHAGTAWFLARLASRTGDPEIQRGLERSLRWLAAQSHEVPGGGAHVLDPSRKDGKAWVGTTGLASLALAESGLLPELLESYAIHIASSVDDKGQVRGNFDTASKTWPEQHEITYAQGQGTLALALAERAGVQGISGALDRAAAYIEGPYWPDPAVNLAVLDEHWMCLTASAVGTVRDDPAGEAICRAYLNDFDAPVAGGAFEPPGVSMGGVGEAVIALAEIERRRGVRGEMHDRAMGFGRWLLALQYQPADAPLLGEPANLLGGFRSRPWQLDVQIDTVQHIACALMGVEQLLTGEEIPGAMP